MWVMVILNESLHNPTHTLTRPTVRCKLYVIVTPAELTSASLAARTPQCAGGHI